MVGGPGTQWVSLDLVGGPRRGSSRARRDRRRPSRRSPRVDRGGLESIAAAVEARRHLLAGGVGLPGAAKVRAEIQQVAREYGAEEVTVVSITSDHGARHRSYELIAEAFG